MNPYEEAELAAAAIADRTGVARHDVAVVLGSGWGDAAAELGAVVWEGPLTEVPGVPRPTVGGHKGRLVSVDAAGRAVLVFAGRSHLWYRFALTREGRPTVVGQDGFCDMTTSGITDLALVCSGFRPANQPT